MELILWRHADAEPGVDDLERKLTAKGRKQAARVAGWLQAHLPAKFTVYSSPAKRALQTAKALDTSVTTSELLAPDRSSEEILRAVDWPNREGEVIVVVGHQPTLGRVVARLLGGGGELSIQKGALWWIEARDKSGKTGVRVRAVLAPEFA
ncbi:MAG TPA: histidine phosphatase family protein [Burkholderiales bacterium]|jgi:phosphohistidine phosphatase|nr:histidine phosphatase family protein [Burkholderiales bacterium]